MLSGWVLPKAIIYEIDEMADRLLLDAFPHNGRLHYYSGPSSIVWDLIAGAKDWNHDRALSWAKDHGAMLIDDSPIGVFLTHFQGIGTFEYFKRNPRIKSDPQKRKAALLPWKHASHLLALSAHGHITTTTTGADLNGVYYAIELSNTLEPDYNGLSATEFLAALSTPRKKEVQDINLLPFAEILNIRDAKGIKAANTTIQLGEIRMGLHEALENADPKAIRTALKRASKEVLRSPAEAYKYFLESQERFLIDRALQMRGASSSDYFFKNKTPDMRQQQREKRLHQFTSKVLLLIEAELALMPPHSRPNFIVPSYINRIAPQ